MAGGARNRRNRKVRSSPVGPETLNALVFFVEMVTSLEDRDDNGDRWAAEKLAVAQAAVDRLKQIRDAIAEKTNEKSPD